MLICLTLSAHHHPSWCCCGKLGFTGSVCVVRWRCRILQGVSCWPHGDVLAGRDIMLKKGIQPYPYSMHVACSVTLHKDKLAAARPALRRFSQPCRTTAWAAMGTPRRPRTWRWPALFRPLWPTSLLGAPWAPGRPSCTTTECNRRLQKALPCLWPECMHPRVIPASCKCDLGPCAVSGSRGGGGGWLHGLIMLASAIRAA